MELPKTDPACPVHGLKKTEASAEPSVDPPAGAPDPELPASVGYREVFAYGHWNESAPDPGAFRCPHCGAWRPAYGFNGQHATMPGMGLVDYVTMYCGECKVIIQVQILALDPAVAGGGRGFRTH
jgi:hypothetical protein